MTIMVFVKVGSRYESREINGASHFIEHLMFKGTKRRPKTIDISQELDRYGAEYNAFTSKDLTAYYVKIDAKQSPLAIDLLHDMLFHSHYDPKEIDRERGVIVEEINMYEDNPRMHIDDLLERALYPDSTLGWDIAGPREVIRSVTREQLIEYRDAYYTPSRVSIVVAGNIHPRARALLEKTFGSVKKPAKKLDKPFTPFQAPKQTAPAFSYQEKKTEQVQLAIAFRGLGVTDKRIPAAQLLGTILGGTMSSRLFIEVREHRGLCYNVSASHQAYEDVGLFSVQAGLERTRVKEAVEVIWKELQKVARHGVDADELKRAKDHIRGKLMLAFEDSSAQADWYGRQWVFQRKLETPEVRLKRIDSVKSKDIQAIAKTLFSKKNMAVAVIGPCGKQEELEQWFSFGSGSRA